MPELQQKTHRSVQDSALSPNKLSSGARAATENGQFSASFSRKRTVLCKLEQKTFSQSKLQQKAYSSVQASTVAPNKLQSFLSFFAKCTVTKTPSQLLIIVTSKLTCRAVSKKHESGDKEMEVIGTSSWSVTSRPSASLYTK